MKNKNNLVATASNSAVFLKSGAEGAIIPVSELSHEKISQVLTELGYVDESVTKNDVQFAVDQIGSKIKPVLVSVARDSPKYGQITLETVNPRKRATVRDTINPSDWDLAFKKLGITPDDYLEHVAWLRENGLPEPANREHISSIERADLTIPDVNEFGYKPQEAPQNFDPTMFVDTDLTIDDLFEFEIDADMPIFTIDAETRKSIQELFEFKPKKQKSGADQE